MPKIVINGQSYHRIEDLPPELRRIYDQTMGAFPDQNQNGVPDMLEGLIAQARQGGDLAAGWGNAQVHTVIQGDAPGGDDWLRQPTANASFSQGQPLPSVPQWHQPAARSGVKGWLVLIAILLAVLIGLVGWLIFKQGGAVPAVLAAALPFIGLPA